MPLSKLRRRLLKQRRFRRVLVILAILSLCLGLLIVSVEKDQGNIKTAGDGLWWAITTVTTVGYGDLYPVTGPGRFIGAVLEVSGIVIFGLLIAIIGSSMNRSQEEFYWNRLFERLNHLEEEIKSVRKHSEFKMKEGQRTASDANRPTAQSSESSATELSAAQPHQPHQPPNSISRFD